MFKFNFELESQGDIANETCCSDDVLGANDDKAEANSQLPYKAEVINLIDEYKHLNTTSYSEQGDRHLNLGEASLIISNPDCSQSRGNTLEEVTKTTDVLPGVYEGGFKVWECAIDLIKFLIAARKDEKCYPWLTPVLNPIDNNISKVLDLGCGHGLPGIAALLLGNENVRVCFQDLNREVLIETTMKNVHKSLSLEVLKDRCEFIAGDWASLQDNRLLGEIDLIFTAETIYSPERKLLHVLRSCIKPNGRILVAAKKYYFGVGGGTTSFMDFIEKNNFPFVCKTLVSITDGESNIRDILELQPKW